MVWRASRYRIQHCNRRFAERFPSHPLRFKCISTYKDALRISRFREARRGGMMPEEETLEHAQEDLREGKSPSTAAGEFVHEEMDHIREGKHGARSTKQAIAIGLSKARRAGVKLPPPKEGTASKETRAQAKRDTEKGNSPH